MDNPNYEEDELGGTTRVLYGATPLYRYMQLKTGDASSSSYLFSKPDTYSQVWVKSRFESFFP